MGVQLSISLLASDRCETLKKCLDSLVPLLKAVPSELIIVYTGEQKETLEIAKNYTEHIIPFTWCDDFSAARNVGVKAAKGEWFLFIDDDEWFESTDEIQQFFLNGEYRSYGAANYSIRNYNDLTGKDYEETNIGRMTRITPDFHFERKIHEQIFPKQYPIKYFKDFVHHYGYAKKVLKSKTDRNIPLLLEDLEKNPLELTIYMQLAQEYVSEKEYDKCLEYCEKAMELPEESKTVVQYYWILAQYPRFLALVGEQKKAREQAEKLTKDPDNCEVGKLSLYIELVNFYAKDREYKKVIEAVGEFRNLLTFMDRNPELWESQAACGFVESQIRGKEADIYLTGVHACLYEENKRYLELFLKWMPWESGVMGDSHYYTLDAYIEQQEKEKDDLQNALAKLNYKNQYIYMQKEARAHQNGNEKDAYNYYEKSADSDSINICCKVLLSALKHNYGIDGMLAYMPVEKWDNCCVMLIRNLNAKRGVELLESLRKHKQSDCIYLMKLEKSILEYILTYFTMDLEENSVYDYGKEYCDKVFTIYEYLFNHQRLESPNDNILPAEYRFARRIGDFYNAYQKEDAETCIQSIKSAVTINGNMTSFADLLIKRAQEHFINEKKEENPEMKALGEQVKVTLKSLIGEGKTAEAAAILNQLLALLPDDLELIRIKQRLHRGN